MANEAFGSKPITDVNAPMILECLKRVEAKGNYETARRLRAKIGAVFRFAVANGVAKTDPTYALRDALITPIVKSRAAITDQNALGGLLRATFSTLANESGLWNPDAIERQLEHVDANVVRRAYARGEHWDERA